MYKIGIALAAIAGFAVAAGDPQGFVQWTAAEHKAIVANILQGKGATKDPNENLTMKTVFLNKQEEVRRTTWGHSGGVEYHENFYDVFCFFSGEGEFIVGGKGIGMKAESPGELRGKSIEGGVTHKFGGGDVVIIPPKTPHQIILAPGHRIEFGITKVLAR